MPVSAETLWNLSEVELLLELLKADVDLIAMIVQLRGLSAGSDGRADGDETERGV